MSSSTHPSPSANKETKEKEAPLPVVIDLGKQRRKRIKDLAKGKPGKLLDEVQETINGLRSEGVIHANAQTVIVVVKERRRSLRSNIFGMR